MTNHVFNYFDVIIFVVFIALNIGFCKTKFNRFCLLYVVLFLILGILLPIISFLIEWQLANPSNEAFDAFTMLYTYLKFPIYWLLFIVQIIIINPILRKKLFEYQKE